MKDLSDCYTLLTKKGLVTSGIIDFYGKLLELATGDFDCWEMLENSHRSKLKFWMVPCYISIQFWEMDDFPKELDKVRDSRVSYLDFDKLESIFVPINKV